MGSNFFEKLKLKLIELFAEYICSSAASKEKMNQQCIRELREEYREEHEEEVKDE